MSMRLAAMERRSFISALWHGAFLALGTSLTQPTTVIAAFVADLTGSTVWVGGLSTVLMVASLPAGRRLGAAGQPDLCHRRQPPQSAGLGAGRAAGDLLRFPRLRLRAFGPVTTTC